MMTKPTCSQVTDLVRSDLRHLPDLPAAQQRELLVVADGLLGVLARRSAHETEWMVEEITQIERLASSLVLDGHDPDGVLHREYGHLGPAGDVRPAELAERYRESSAVLDVCVTLAMRAGGEARRHLDAVIDARISHEQEIRGDLSIVRE